MSHADYIAQLDEDQLKSLIEHAQARIKAIESTGWVKLWTINIGWANVAWFALEDYDAALEFAGAAIKAYARQRPSGIEVEISAERYRPEEVPGLLARTKNSGKTAGEPLVTTGNTS